MTYTLAAAIVVGTVFLSCLGLVISRRFIKPDILKQRHDVTGNFLALSGSIYAILIGMIIVDSMNYQQVAKETIDGETANLADIYIMASNLPKGRRTAMRKKAREYVDQVISSEWGLMTCGDSCPLAGHLGVELISDLMTFQPKSESEKNVYPMLVEESQNFWQNRQKRLTEAARKIPPIELGALLIGAIFLIGWTYYLDADHFWMQLTMTAMVATLIALNFILLFLFTYPFRGDFAIQTDPFTRLQSVFDEIDEASGDSQPKAET
ncbi:MAG TPA: hypothetical protein V6C72_07485 [Chroococcales cyanobacterium]